MFPPSDADVYWFPAARRPRRDTLWNTLAGTPQCVVQVLVAMLEPYEGSVFDPCCGSGGMFMSPEKFVEEHGGYT